MRKGRFLTVIADEAVRKYGLRALLLVVAMALAPFAVLVPPGNLLWALVLATLASELLKRVRSTKKNPNRGLKAV